MHGQKIIKLWETKFHAHTKRAKFVLQRSAYFMQISSDWKAIINTLYHNSVGQNSVATRYGLDGPGIESFHTPCLTYNTHQFILGSKAARA